MEELIAEALNAAGYLVKPTVENLMECFKDYVAEGFFSNLSLDDGEVFNNVGEKVESIKAIARNLIQCCKR